MMWLCELKVASLPTLNINSLFQSAVESYMDEAHSHKSAA